MVETQVERPRELRRLTGRPDSGAGRGPGAQAVAHDGEQIAGRGVHPACAVAWHVAPTSEDHRRGRSRRGARRRRPALSARARRRRRAGPSFTSADDSSNSSPGAHDGDEQVALGCALLHDVGPGSRRNAPGWVVGVRQRPGIAPSSARQPIEQDRLAELLLGGEMAARACPRPHRPSQRSRSTGDLDPLEERRRSRRPPGCGPDCAGRRPAGGRGGRGRPARHSPPSSFSISGPTKNLSSPC